MLPQAGRAPPAWGPELLSSCPVNAHLAKGNGKSVLISWRREREREIKAETERGRETEEKDWKKQTGRRGKRDWERGDCNRKERAGGKERGGSKRKRQREKGETEQREKNWETNEEREAWRDAWEIQLPTPTATLMLVTVPGSPTVKNPVLISEADSGLLEPEI